MKNTNYLCICIVTLCCLLMSCSGKKVNAAEPHKQAESKATIETTIETGSRQEDIIEVIPSETEQETKESKPPVVEEETIPESKPDTDSAEEEYTEESRIPDGDLEENDLGIF